MPVLSSASRRPRRAGSPRKPGRSPIWTDAALLKLSKDGGKHELLEGKLHMSPVGYTHGAICRRLFLALALHAEKHALGDVLDSNVGYRLGTTGARGSVLSPDVSFVAAARLKQLLTDPDKFLQGAPDLAVEVLSPSDAAATVARKVRKYLAHGTQAVWVVDPATATVTVHSADSASVVRRSGETLEGPASLPGFRLGVTKIFG